MIDYQNKIDSVIQDICEFDDRTSPEDYPDYLLVLPEELDMVIKRHFVGDEPTLFDAFEKEIVELKAKLAKYEKLEGCVVVPKSEITNWYLDEDESIYIDEPDSFLCDLEPGDVLEVKRQQCWTVENQFAAKVYTDEDNIFWEFFDSEKEAEKAAAHCKAMLEAARSGNE